MTATLPAVIYAASATLPILMHLGLVAGAPWGRFTVGGKFPHALPPLWRGFALVQVGLLVLMAASVLSFSGVLDAGLPPLLFWVTLGLTALTALANAASRSRPERMLWGPVTGVMFIASLAVALL
ncbi:MAG: hypothetical protein VX874_14635 [Pseudomonadota bacterium]|nr:hypothetical protein [Pseudomonadota bacterium]